MDVASWHDTPTFICLLSFNQLSAKDHFFYQLQPIYNVNNLLLFELYILLETKVIKCSLITILLKVLPVTLETIYSSRLQES